MRPDDFIRTNTGLIAPPLVPEVRLHLATEIMPLWRKTEEELEAEGIPPPYWAFAWAGGQALSRYVLDNPQEVRGKKILDFGAGSGMVAVAAKKAGARDVLAADIDRFAAAAIALNAAANETQVDITTDDVIGREGWDVILVGDMCYERPLAERLMAWLAKSNARVLLGDPGRSYFPKSSVEKLATYRVETTRELEDREIRETSVYALVTR
ncbi:MAG TPA: 50S ribosomal protein L11 methyltransferase [Rhizomicrobium sp.]|nr:50S ribosomal protein L11 methyltransferase [Rhizomicrobium sp.]